jgi:hypothetical protein
MPLLGRVPPVSDASAKISEMRSEPSHGQQGWQTRDWRVPGSHSGPFGNCANPGCRSGWLHLWRSRSAPVFEGGWTCSAECTAARMMVAVNRELDGRGETRAGHRHRVPLGLLMLEKGWITQEQLRAAVEAQKNAGDGRLGEWLVRQKAVSESQVTRALSLQWSCPVLPIEFHDSASLAGVMPRLFLDAFGSFPFRLAAGKVLYLAFEESLDPVLALAVDRMNGLRVVSGIVQESLFRPAHSRMMAAKFPPLELMESVSETPAAYVLARSIERHRPVASRLIRVHDCLWLRMWLRPQSGLLPDPDTVRDVICRIGLH